MILKSKDSPKISATIWNPIFDYLDRNLLYDECFDALQLIRDAGFVPSVYHWERTIKCAIQNKLSLNKIIELYKLSLQELKQANKACYMPILEVLVERDDPHSALLVLSLSDMEKGVNLLDDEVLHLLSAMNKVDILLDLLHENGIL